MKVMTFNIQHCHNYIVNKVDNEMLTEEIKRISPDVLVINEIYGEDIKEIKVTLPSDSGYKGKEMAAFGGLKSTEDIPQIEPFIYLGGDQDIDISQVSNVLDDNGKLRENVAVSIAENAYQMKTNIDKLLDKLIMPMKNISSNVKEHRTTVIKAAKDPKYISTRSVVSTLFFTPVQQIIFDIENKLEFRN